MTLWILGAHNKTNLQRRSIRWLIGDETWRWPQGHMAEAEARVTAFGWLGNCLFMSQGGEDYKLEIVKSGYKRGETWEEEGAIDPRTGKVLAAPLPERSGLIPLRFITVDCQMDHLFAVVRSWSAEGSRRLVWNERILTFTDIIGLYPSSGFVHIDSRGTNATWRGK